MPTIRAVLDLLDGTAPWAKAAGWDPVGLQVGDPDASIDRIGVCHDLTPSVLDAAVERGIGLVVAYHPLLFEPTRSLIKGRGPSGTAFSAAASGVAVAVVHTAFDVAPGGTADAMADALGLDAVRGIGPLWGGATVKVVTFVPASSVDEVASSMAAAGAGSIGGYTGCSFRSSGEGTFTAGVGGAPTVGESGRTTTTAETRLEMVVPLSKLDGVVGALNDTHPYEEPAYDVIERRGEAGFVGRVGSWTGTIAELSDLVADRFGTGVRRAGDPDRTVRSVVVVPGSGASLIGATAGLGADVIVTGDVKHHDARAALGAGIAVIDPGHAATERPGVARLYAAVAAGWDDTVDLTGIDGDPWTR